MRCPYNNRDHSPPPIITFMHRLATSTIIVIFITGFLFVLPLVGRAETNEDPLGWTDKTCQDAKGYWYYERCLAAPPTINLQVDIPGLSGKKELAIGTYLATVYKFGVGAGAVLAVVVIIIGGFIWMTSMGNQAMITLAKGYIGGAVVGLVILLLSFIILRTVNPRLVDFTPLRIYKLRSQNISLFGEFCDTSPDSGKQYYDINSQQLVAANVPLSCGRRYFVGVPGGNDTCLGSMCTTSGQGSYCLPTGEKEVGKSTAKYDCQEDVEEVCNLLTDDITTSIGLADNQSACDAVNTPLRVALKNDPIKIIGSCVWVDTSWNPLADDDACHWCPQPIYQDLEQQFLGPLKSNCQGLVVGVDNSQTPDQKNCSIVLCQTYCGGNLESCRP